jgi:MinD superfamily P-loop ATPase
MIIGVASGKGGTGKTTIATNLVAAVESDVRLLDCDVEEPNAHLFLQPEVIETRAVGTFVPEIDIERCNFCGQCVDICQFRAIVLLKNDVLTFPELCHSCRGCQKICPQNAVKDSSRELGTIRIGRKNGIAFTEGRMNVGEAMAPPLIRAVRKTGTACKTTVIDAPPGTSCPMIASVIGSDFILLVTEPTPFGLHDLKLAVETVKRLSIPCGIVINRFDKGDDSVFDLAENENIPVLLKIPFDKKIAQAYSKGHLLVEEIPSWRKPFAELGARIENIVKGNQA